MPKLPNQQTEHVHEGLPSMPDSLAKDAAKYAQKGVPEAVQDKARCGGDAGADNGDSRRKQMMKHLECIDRLASHPKIDAKKIYGDFFVQYRDLLLATADEAKQEHERIAK